MFTVILLFIVGCQNQSLNEDGVDNDEKAVVNEENEHEKQLAIEITESEARFALEDLMEIVDGSYHFDELHRTLTISHSRE